jgi:hypothetical protein
MADFLKTIFIVNAIFAVTYGIFIQICLWCAEYGVTPWFSIPGTLGICGGLYWKLLRAASRRVGT